MPSIKVRVTFERIAYEHVDVTVDLEDIKSLRRTEQEVEIILTREAQKWLLNHYMVGNLEITEADPDGVDVSISEVTLA